MHQANALCRCDGRIIEFFNRGRDGRRGQIEQEIGMATDGRLFCQSNELLLFFSWTHLAHGCIG
jgi:hypothetical protein